MIPVTEWGKDHWSTFAYLETLAVDNEGIGIPDSRRMRKDGKMYPTILKNGNQNGHNDYNCLEDAEEAGFIQNLGTGILPQYKFTPLGIKAANALRLHKMNGGNFHSFVWEEQS